MLANIILVLKSSNFKIFISCNRKGFSLTILPLFGLDRIFFHFLKHFDLSLMTPFHHLVIFDTPLEMNSCPISNHLNWKTQISLSIQNFVDHNRQKGY